MFPAAIILGFLLLGCAEARSLTEDSVAAELNEDLAVEFQIFTSILSNRFGKKRLGKIWLEKIINIICQRMLLQSSITISRKDNLFKYLPSLNIVSH